MNFEINGITIDIHERREINIDLDEEDKIAVTITEGGMGCYEDSQTKYISIKDLYTFLNDQEKLFDNEANKICEKRKSNMETLEKNYSESIEKNKILESEIETLKKSILLLQY